MLKNLILIASQVSITLNASDWEYQALPGEPLSSSSSPQHLSWLVLELPVYREFGMYVCK